MARLLFQKTGRAIWISHLDLMRLFQRAFKRAGLQLKHTQGYNPRPSVSIALPLSVGVESCCELLDFDLEGDSPALDEVTLRLNNALTDGVQVLKTYEGGRKLRDLALLHCEVLLQYDNGVDHSAVGRIEDLFQSASLLVSKKSKNGPVEQDIIPMIRQLTVTQKDTCSVSIRALICCQNPSMNPVQLAQAVDKYLPGDKPDHYVCRRLEICDMAGKVFR